MTVLTMSAIKVRLTLYQTLDWLKNIEAEMGLNTLLDCMPNGFGGRKALQKILYDLRPPNCGYRVWLYPNAYNELIFLGFGRGDECAYRRSLGYNDENVFDVFSDIDFSQQFDECEYIQKWEKMDDDEVYQWA